MEIKNDTIRYRGKNLSFKLFKRWVYKFFQPVIGKYRIGLGRYDWQSVVSDMARNGAIEIFINETQRENGLT